MRIKKWSQLRSDQQEWFVNSEHCNGCGPQKTAGGIELCPLIVRIDDLTDGDVLSIISAPAWLRLYRERADRRDVLRRVCSLGTPACVAHDWDYLRGVQGGGQKTADKALRNRWATAVRESDMSRADKALGLVVVRLAWVGCRVGGGKNYPKQRLSYDELLAMGFPG